MNKALFLLPLTLLCTAKQTIQIKIHSKVPLIKLEDEQELFASNVAKLIEYIYLHGYRCTFGEAYRTQEQAMIYAQEGKGIVNSLHRERLAVDLNIFDANDKLLTTVKECTIFGDYWESLHPLNRWGGRWKKRPDFDHYEMDREQ